MVKRHLRLVRPPRQDSSTGLDTRLASVICYVLGWITGLIFFLVERKDHVVRFHAAQSLLTFGVLTVTALALNLFSGLPLIGFVFTLASWLLGVLTVGLWIFLMVKAASGTIYRLPVIGDAAARNLF